MVYVIKVKYGDTLRRFTFESKPRTEELSFSVLENKIRKLFGISAEKQICVTYNDGDNDVITMADDQDLVDALVMQSLNPLRLFVASTEPKNALAALATSADTTTPKSDDVIHDSSVMTNLFASDCVTAERLKELNDLVVRGASASPAQWADMARSFMKSLPSPVPAPAADMVLDEKSRPIPGSVPASPFEAYWSGAAASGPAFSRVIAPPRRLPEVSPSPVKNEGTEVGETKTSTRVFHTGVQCDGCGMSPIAGPRFKSTKKHDFDLCQNCFKDADDQADYNRIDRPLYRPRHLHAGSGRMRCPAMDVSSNYNQWRHASLPPYCSRPAARWGAVDPITGVPYGGKLDSRFVEDVTIMDGTEMAPSAHFTKIWRLRNSGKATWPPQTKLVHVGGDELGNVFVVPLQLPEHGLLPDQEVEAAVDLVAPEKPGRYVSHWRLASPAGPKFGHRVWVVIQVVTKEHKSFNTLGSEIHGNEAHNSQQRVSPVEDIPLFAPPIRKYESREAFVKASHEAVEQPEGKQTYPEMDIRSFCDVAKAFSGVNMFDTEKATEPKEENPPVAASEEEIPTETDVVLEEPFTENGVVLEEVPAETDAVLEEAVAVESSELGGGFSMVEIPSNGSTPVTSVSNSPKEEVEVSRDNKEEQNGDSGVGDSVEDLNNLSVQLEAMGFSDRKLNLELLLENDLDLRRTIDELFAAADWDPILEELEEMGFYDYEMNRRLMFKNKGSVKRVVKELVQLYKKRDDEGEKMKGVARQ